MSNANRWTGLVMSGLPALFLLVDGIMKLFKPAVVVDTTVQLGFPEPGRLRIVGGFALVVVRFRGDAGLEKLVVALKIDLSQGQIRLGAVDGGLLGSDGIVLDLQTGFGGGGVGFGRCNAGALRLDIRIGLDTLDPGDNLAAPHAIPFFDRQLHDPALCVRS